MTEFPERRIYGVLGNDKFLSCLAEQNDISAIVLYQHQQQQQQGQIRSIIGVLCNT